MQTGAGQSGQLMTSRCAAALQAVTKKSASERAGSSFRPRTSCSFIIDAGRLYDLRRFLLLENFLFRQVCGAQIVAPEDMPDQNADDCGERHRENQAGEAEQI